MKRILGILTLSLLFTAPTAAQSNAVGDWLRQYRFDLGISIPTLTVEVRRVSTGQVGGMMIGRYLPQPVLSLSSPPHYLWKGFNYNFAFAYSWQALDEQQMGLELETVDLQTFADAYGLYGLIIAGYTFGSEKISRHQGLNFRLGVGVGTGWILAKGEVVLTEEPGMPRVAFDINQFAFISAALMELRWKAYSTRLMVEAPTIAQDDLRFSFLKFTLQLAYSFTPGDFQVPRGHYKKLRKMKLSHWTADYTAFVGSRPLPVVSSLRYDPENINATGGGIQVAFKKRHWPLHIVAAASTWKSAPLPASTDFFDATGTTRTASMEGTGRALDLGFRSMWREKKRIRPFVEAGVTTFWSEISGTLEDIPVSDQSMSFGFWIGTGAQWVLYKKWIIAAQLRGLDATSKFFGVRHHTIGLQGQMNIGYHY
jgi:hypothetical protein